MSLAEIKSITGKPSSATHLGGTAWCREIVRSPACLVDSPVVDPGVVPMTDLEQWSAEFDDVRGRVSSLFVHPASRRHAEQYLRGLFSPIARKNGWTIAEYTGEKEPKAMQRFLNLATWEADTLLDFSRISARCGARSVR